jgi:hypothetical protein
MSDNKVSTRQGLAIGGGQFLGMGSGFMLIPILGGTAMVGGIIAGMGIGLFTAAFMKDKL